MKNSCTSALSNFGYSNLTHQYHFWARHTPESHTALPKFPPLTDTASPTFASNMWNTPNLNLKKIGSSKLKLTDFRIESKLPETRVEFSEPKDANVSNCIRNDSKLFAVQMTDHCFAKFDSSINTDHIETADLKFVAELFPDPNDDLHITKLYREGNRL